jgi:hypothetical protein
MCPKIYKVRLHKITAKPHTAEMIGGSTNDIS